MIHAGVLSYTRTSTSKRFFNLKSFEFRIQEKVLRTDQARAMASTSQAQPLVSASELVEPLERTLSSEKSVRDSAETQLKSLAERVGFGTALLRLCDLPSSGIDVGLPAEISAVISVAASIYFKNFVRREWNAAAEDGVSVISPEEKQQIRLNIVNLMLRVDEKIQKQLSDAVSIIGRFDFPKNWPTLLPDMTKQMQQAINSVDFRMINGILRTFHALFKRYRYETRSDKLFEEINEVVGLTGVPLNEVFFGTMKLIEQYRDNKQAVPILFSTLLHVVKVYHSLVVQDIPQHFEDTLKEWFEAFAELLLTDNAVLTADADEERPTLLEDLKSYICQVLELMATKYDDDFKQYIGWFFEAVFKLLSSNPQQLSAPRFDQLSCHGVMFLSSVVRHHFQGQLNAMDERSMVALVEKIVVPNIELRRSDVELFEDNPEEYIRRDVEGSDVDTRRRAASDLVRSMLQVRDTEITTLLGNYVVAALEQYKASPAQNWAKKDSAIYLTTSIAGKQEKITERGVENVNPLVDVVAFAQSHILPELAAADVDERAIIKSDCLKFLVIFRNQIPDEVLLGGFYPPANDEEYRKNNYYHIIKLLKSRSVVLHTYAAHCVEKLFTLRKPESAMAVAAAVTADPYSKLRIQPERLQPYAQETLFNLFAILNTGPSPQRSAAAVAGSSQAALSQSTVVSSSQLSIGENDYVMKAIMRALTFYRGLVAPIVGGLAEEFARKLDTIMQASTSSKPNFTHYLFESMCICVNLSVTAGGDHARAAVRRCEELWMPIFEHVLKKDVVELVPYVLQTLSVLLEANQLTSPDAARLLPDAYLMIYADLMRPHWYEHEATIPAIVKLLEVYYSSSSLAGLKQLEPYLERTLGLIQKLLTTRKVENEGFRLLRAVFAFLPPQIVMPFEPLVMKVILTRMQVNKTPKFCLCFVQFLAFLMHRRGIAHVQALFDGIQSDLLLMVWEKIVLENAARANGLQRKLLVVVMTEFLGDVAIFKRLAETNQQQMWATTLRCVLNLVTDAQAGGLMPSSAFSAAGGAAESRQENLLFWEIREDMSDARGITAQDVNVQMFNQLVNTQRPPRDDAEDVRVEEIPRRVMMQLEKISAALGRDEVPRLCSTLDETTKEALNTIAQSTQSQIAQ